MGKKRDLLMKDISSRLSYGIICRVKYIINNETTDGEDVESEVDDKIIAIDTEYNEVKTEWLNEWNSIDNIRPYLRLLSSMTDDEKKQLYVDVMKGHDEDYEEFKKAYPDDLRYLMTKYCFSDAFLVVDWMNEHHFDYRMLIEKGLAIEITEKNNPYE